MARFVFVLASLLFISFVSISTANYVPNVFCYYDSRTLSRQTQGKMLPSDLDPALAFCTHLIYGYAGINGENKLVSLNENLDLDVGRGNFRVMTMMKKKYPTLKVLLSVGGDAELEDADVYKYNTLLESRESRAAFISSASDILKNYGFDGIDLAWQFPKIKPKRVRSGIGNFWHSVKRVFTGKKIIDAHAEEHKAQFTELLSEMRNHLGNYMMMTVSVLPNVNSSLYFDIHGIIPSVDFVILHGYDFNTADRNPKEADYTAPLYPLLDREPDSNINSSVSYWTKKGFPGDSLILGIATYGRAWKLDSDSKISGVPPIHADGAAPEGYYSKAAGILNYPEICSQMVNSNQKGEQHLRKVTDPSKRYGTYAFRLPDDSGEGGMWVAFDDAETVGNKAGFVRAKALGGVAINDLSMDDFRGLCSGDKFPLLRSAKYRL